MQKKLYRSRENKVLTSLYGRTADYFNQDASTVRLIVVVLEFATIGLLILGYIIASIIVPKAPDTAPLGKE